MASLPSDFSADAVAAIRACLDDVRSGGAKILFAIESGSRAWGFPSPDSDYDCRFVYARPASQHLVLEQARDVIEFPIHGDTDAGGWDLRKALLLALSGNATVVEWARSPIVYEEVAGFRSRFLSLLEQIVDPAKVSKHYLGLALAHMRRGDMLDGEIKLKRVFYALRPLIALDWMEQNGFALLPPMDMMECLRESDTPAAVADEIHGMVEIKKRTREMGLGVTPPLIARHIEARYQHHLERGLAPGRDEALRVRDRMAADAFYRREVETT